MRVEKKDLEKSQIELTVELSLDEFKPYIEKGVKKVSQEVKIEGFRPGKVPYEILKQKIGDMTILEEAARIAINKTLDEVIENNIKEQPVGQPQINITKIAPDNPMEYKIVLAILPKIILGNYKDAKIKPEKMEMKDEEINKTLEYLQETRAKETNVNREIKNGDKVIVNIEIFLDKVPIEGGQSKDTEIIIGKEYFVPGFSEKLIGAKKAGVSEFNLPYPEDHHQKNLAGKLVDFKVSIKEVYQRILPELNDEFAKSLGVKNLDELKDNIRKNIEMEKKLAADQKTEIKMLDKIMANTKFSDLPEILIEHESMGMLDELEHTITSQGGKFDDYLTSLKKTRDQLMLDLLPDAIKRVKRALMIREIALEEKIKVEEDEINKKIEELIKQYKGDEKVEKRINEQGYRMYLQNTLTNGKVINKLREWNIEN
ncbi:MAG: trigger factor [Patescibacteria group bacterium]